MEELHTNSESFYDIESDQPFKNTVTDEYLAGEIVHLWSHRENCRHLMNIQRADMLKVDTADLGELLYRMKRKLSKLGRNGAWNSWLKQQNISRSTADRLVLEFAEKYSLVDELPHYNLAEPLEGNICLAANRTNRRLQKVLKTPKSRMAFIRCLADLLEIIVDCTGNNVRLSIPPPFNENEFQPEPVPNLIELQDDGTVRPVNYELKEDDDEAIALP